MAVGEEKARNKHHLRIMNEANERGTHVGDAALDGLVCRVRRIIDGRQNFVEVVLLR
jgi:hypothetical protein